MKLNSLSKDDLCRGCKRLLISNRCSIFSPMVHNIRDCPCISCIVKSMCTSPCRNLKKYVDSEMLKEGIPL